MSQCKQLYIAGVQIFTLDTSCTEFIDIHINVPHWPTGYRARLAISRSWVRIPAAALPSATWATCLHTCSVIKQYNLVPANGRWCSTAGTVTTALVERNGSLLPGLWLRSPVGWQLRTGRSSGTLRSFRVWTTYQLNLVRDINWTDLKLSNLPNHSQSNFSVLVKTSTSSNRCDIGTVIDDIVYFETRVFQ